MSDGGNLNWDEITGGTVPTLESKLTTSLEGPTRYVEYEPNDDLNHYADFFDGWFKAPDTGSYRFYLASDDSSRLYLDSVNTYSSGQTPATTMVAEKSGYSDWRKYEAMSLTTDYDYISDWIFLTAGEFYKLEAYHYEDGGSAHFTASVEFQQSNTAGHPKANKEVQKFKID